MPRVKLPKDKKLLPKTSRLTEGEIGDIERAAKIARVTPSEYMRTAAAWWANETLETGRFPMRITESARIIEPVES